LEKFVNFAKVFLISVLVILACEAGAHLLAGALSPLTTTLIIRLVQGNLLLLLLKFTPGGLALAGVSRQYLTKGIKTGAVWSILFGCIVLLLGGTLFLAGLNPLRLVRSPIPFTGVDLFLFFLTGGVVAPIAEELFFRGILYVYLRQFNIVVAVILSTLIFAFSHGFNGGVPFFQIIGGLVFALSFEHSKSLAAPVIIHVLGNLALFTLSIAP
jgi:hypothetical protein